MSDQEVFSHERRKGHSEVMVKRLLSKAGSVKILLMRTRVEYVGER
jgi:hypothetical protein